jgi:hypothetical protein
MLDMRVAKDEEGYLERERVLPHPRRHHRQRKE